MGLHNKIMSTDNKDFNKLKYNIYDTVLARLKLKDNKMYKHITKVGKHFQ